MFHTDDELIVKLDKLHRNDKAAGHKDCNKGSRMHDWRGTCKLGSLSKVEEGVAKCI